MSILKLNNKIVKLGGKLVTLSAAPAETVTDYDGNIYTTVTIGTQTWTAQNLKTTHYNDGTPIPNISNYDDWFLPSIDELTQIWNQLYTWGFGNFSAVVYSSSSEHNATQAKVFSFGGGSATWTDKSSVISVRACRSFTGGTYSLRDIGPAGGLIFITGATYYECAPTDQSINQAWSNITGTTLGTTGTAIGTGQGNTTAIIGQAGHTNSAAKLCDDLTSDMLWGQDINGAYCYYNNDTLNKPIYGGLYNWYSVNNLHGLAPTGWSVPSNADWTTLTTYLGGTSVAGGKLKEVGTTHWASPNTDATNDYGFTVLPGGYRHHSNGGFSDIFNQAVFFSSTSRDTTRAWDRILGRDGAYCVTWDGYKRYGYSIRFIKN